MTEKQAQAHFEKLKEYLKKEFPSISLELRNYEYGGAYLHFNKKIIIDGNLTSTEKVWALLHEIGHAEDMSRAHHDRDFNDQDRFSKKWLKLKIEIVAWKYSLKVAKSLGIKPDLNFLKLAIKALFTYVH